MPSSDDECRCTIAMTMYVSEEEEARGADSMIGPLTLANRIMVQINKSHVLVRSDNRRWMPHHAAYHVHEFGNSN